MDDLFKWLLTSGDQFSVGGLLAAALVFVVTALYREWVVMGGPYKRCMKRVAEFEEKATREAIANEQKISMLEAKVEELRTRDARRRT